MKKFLFTFIIEMVLLTALAVLVSFGLGDVSNIYNVPLEAVVNGLRKLASMGWWGNGLALAIIVGICFIPAAFSIKNWGKATQEKYRKMQMADNICLGLTSLGMLLVFYIMMNPTSFINEDEYAIAIGAANEAGVSVESYLNFYMDCAWVIFSLIVLALVFHMVNLFINSEKEKLMTYTGTLTYVAFIILAACVHFEIVELVTSMGKLSALEKLATSFKALSNISAYFFDLGICCLIYGLLKTVEENNAEKIVKQADKICKTCCIALVATLGLVALANLLQLANMPYISNRVFSLNIPFVSIGFALITLLLSRLLFENKKLRDDNELFV